MMIKKVVVKVAAVAADKACNSGINIYNVLHYHLNINLVYQSIFFCTIKC